MRALLLVAAALLTGCVTVPDRAPAQTYAWATFDRTGIIASGASGLADRRAGRALTIDDPVRIASVSKLVVALGVMRMVEAGELDLNADASRQFHWRLRNPAFPDRPVTLRHLLSHTSTLTDRVDYAVPLGTRLQSVVEQPAAFDREHAPGSFFRYSNLNYPMIASVMEVAAADTFDRLMARRVMTPLGLDACFNWTTCSDAAVMRAVVLYSPSGQVIRDDLQGRRPDCPVLNPNGEPCYFGTYDYGSNGALFSPQGGLRISVRDLATVGRLLLNRGRHGNGQFLSSASIDLLIQPIWIFNGSNGETERGFYCAYGLAVQSLPVRQADCNDDLLGGGRRVLGHAGEAYGVRSGLWLDPARGRGIAFFATGLGDSPPRGRSAYTAIEEWLAGHID